MDEPDDAAGIGTLISRLLHDARAYARAEGDYYRALAAERATHAGIAAGLAAAALFLLMAVVTATLVGVLLLLAQMVGLAWATLIVLVVGLVIVALLGRAAVQRARRVTLPTKEIT
ncbi:MULTISPECIES: phage holin family protein [unclassified Sphingomonas]|uniref:phage holin family protein n=1 Tax=unclassified Sphingomonas TaxID=196159 RepID=UPI0008326F8C|nr:MULTISPECIES: phage holin family protein [unclassified Sphingomonas]